MTWVEGRYERAAVFLIFIIILGLFFAGEDLGGGVEERQFFLKRTGQKSLTTVTSFLLDFLDC